MGRHVEQGLQLSDSQRRALQATARRRRAPAADVQRARIILACAEGRSASEVAASMGLTSATVRKWCSRFLAAGLDGLADDPRSGRPRARTPDLVAQIVRCTVWSDPPGSAAEWTTRSLAEHLGLSQSTVSRALRETGMTPSVMASCRTLAASGFWSRKIVVRGLVVDREAVVAGVAVGDEQERAGVSVWVREVESGVTGDSRLSIEATADVADLGAWGKRLGATHLLAGGRFQGRAEVAPASAGTVLMPALPWWGAVVANPF